MAATMASTSATAADRAARSVLSRPLPASPPANSLISLSTAPRATPWSRRVLRKNRSMPWIAVVPSYRLSILAVLVSLRDGNVWEDPGAAVGLQGQREQLGGPLRADALDHRQQQVVDAGR